MMLEILNTHQLNSLFKVVIPVMKVYSLEVWSILRVNDRRSQWAPSAVS